MDDVTGFNQKSPEYDGEKLVIAGVNKLRARYTESFSDIMGLMLRFREPERPSFVELFKIITPNTELPKFAPTPKGVTNEL